jgi:hypothetical protein
MLDIVENKQIKEENLTIHTFGSSEGKQDKYTIREIVLQSDDGYEKITLKAIAALFTAKATAPRHREETFPQEGELADKRKPGDTRTKFDIIIGCDHYWFIVEHRIVKLANEIISCSIKME